MNDKKFYENLSTLIGELSRGLRHICLNDYAMYNEICIEITKRKKEAQEIPMLTIEDDSPREIDLKEIATNEPGCYKLTRDGFIISQCFSILNHTTGECLAGNGAKAKHMRCSKGDYVEITPARAEGKFIRMNW